jgi:hypothetical protein
MDNLKLFPVSDVVMYKYYIGRLKMFEDKYEEARLVIDIFLFLFFYDFFYDLHLFVNVHEKSKVICIYI